VCGKHIQLSKLKEWIQRHVEYSRSETLMATLQDWVPGRAETPEVVIISIILPSAQVPPVVPHWLSTRGCTFFSLM
jgi:hypothetical protein